MMVLTSLYKERQAAVLGGASVLLFVLLWEATAQLKLVDPLFLASPTLVVKAGVEMFAGGEIYKHLLLSGQEFAMGFFLGAFVGVLMGLAMARIQWINHVATPFMDALYSTPMVIFLPVLVFWFGIGIWTKVLLIVLGSLFPVLINTFEGARNVDPTLVEAARSYGASKRDLFFKVVLVSAIPFVVSGLRLGIGRAVIMMLVAEFFIATGGLGYVLAVAGTSFQTSKVFVVAALVALMGVTSTQFLLWYQHRIAPWLYARQVE
ncbi:MAG: ABC transporter permease [Dehalococcoidia bacterium]|nr:ABC transporter permease [Dehalococcoidia bacterium]